MSLLPLYQSLLFWQNNSENIFQNFFRLLLHSTLNHVEQVQRYLTALAQPDLANSVKRFTSEILNQWDALTSPFCLPCGKTLIYPELLGP